MGVCLSVCVTLSFNVLVIVFCFVMKAFVPFSACCCLCVQENGPMTKRTCCSDQYVTILPPSENTFERAHLSRCNSRAGFLKCLSHRFFLSARNQ